MGRPKKSELELASTGRVLRIRTTKLQSVQLSDYCDLHGIEIEDVVKRAIDYYLFWLKKQGKYVPRPHAREEQVNLELYKIKVKELEGRELTPDEEGMFLQAINRGVNPQFEGL